MTPFMDEVQGVLDGETPRPARCEPTATEGLGAGADRQLHVRALAEQLVSEANAVLADRSVAITLVDDTGPGALAFTLGFDRRTARIETTFDGRSATARLVGGSCEARTRRLTGDAEVAAVVLDLLVDDSLAHRP